MRATAKMKDVQAKGKRDPALREVIRKELCTETNRRFLSRMPAFRPEREVPDMFASLLGELDLAESGRS